MNKEKWISALNLIPHPEGGFYHETIKSEHALNAVSYTHLDVYKRQWLYFL